MILKENMARVQNCQLPILNTLFIHGHVLSHGPGYGHGHVLTHTMTKNMTMTKECEPHGQDHILSHGFGHGQG